MIPPSKHPETGPLKNVWREFNRLRDFALSCRLGVSRNVRVHRTSAGTTLALNIDESESGAPAIQQFKISAIADDTISVHTWDGTNEGTEGIVVAKPYRLRRTGWDGVTHTYDFNGTVYSVLYSYLNVTGFRTAQSTSNNVQTTESQAIIPIYKVGDIIYATEPEGGTSVTGATWLDLNVDARAWACY